MKAIKRILSAFLCTSVIFGTLAVDTAAMQENITAEISVSAAQKKTQPQKLTYDTFSLADIPAYSGNAYVSINENMPFFYKSDLTKKSFEKYAELDDLGRCGAAYACIGTDIMPTEERGTIGQIKPTGWQTVKYDCVDGKYLYNRCHLIGYQLSGENANEKNLITGTRYMNTEGMLPFENMVADYVKETESHVLYRVTPMFSGKNLLAKGVLMEAYSVEDSGEGICFNVFCYNVQPEIKINYANGKSSYIGKPKKPQTTVNPKNTETVTTTATVTEKKGQTYILNTNTKKFHNPGCSSVKQMSEKNKQEYTGSRDDIINKGYSPCKRCNP